MHPAVLGCFHCLGTDHWQQACPLLVPPASKAEHEQRINEYIRQFNYEEIGCETKTRLIAKEVAMWKQVQKEMARK